MGNLSIQNTMVGFDFPDIGPVALSLGPLVIRWYALAYVAGFLLGWRYALHLAGLYSDEKRPSREDMDDFLTWAIAGVILGGRLGYTLFYNFDLYAANPLQILKIWEGGMSFHGGVLGVMVAMIIFSKLRGASLLRLSDIVCACVPIGLFLGRIANFINGELYGRVTDVWWAVRFPAGGYEPRHPSQLYEAVLEGAVIFLVLFVIFKSEKLRYIRGLSASLFLVLYGSFRFVIEYFRQPDAHLGAIAFNLSMGQLLCLPMVACGFGLLIYAVQYHAKRA